MEIWIIYKYYESERFLVFSEIFRFFIGKEYKGLKNYNYMKKNSKSQTHIINHSELFRTKTKHRKCLAFSGFGNRKFPKDLNTYDNNICYERMFNNTYLGLSIIISNSAMRELMKESKTLYDVIEILEQGTDAPRKRKIGTIEKWFSKGNKIFNAVIVKDYNEHAKKECWVLIHFGKFTKKRYE